MNKLVYSLLLALFVLVCGCRSDRFELKYAEHQQLKENVLCEHQDVAVIIETSDEYNRNTIGRLLADELSMRSEGRIKAKYAPAFGNIITNESFVKVAFTPDYSGGPGVNAGLAFGLAEALVGEMMRDKGDYGARYSGVIESRLKGRQLIRKEGNVLKLMKVEEAVGQMLCHDITQIIPGVKKGPVQRVRRSHQLLRRI